MNKIWCLLLISGILISLLTGNINNLGNIMIDSSMKAFNIFFKLESLFCFGVGYFKLRLILGWLKDLVNY